MAVSCRTTNSPLRRCKPGKLRVPVVDSSSFCFLFPASQRITMLTTIDIAITKSITSEDESPVIFAPHNDSDETMATTTPQRSQLLKPPLAIIARPPITPMADRSANAVTKAKHPPITCLITRFVASCASWLRSLRSWQPLKSLRTARFVIKATPAIASADRSHYSRQGATVSCGLSSPAISRS